VWTPAAEDNALVRCASESFHVGVVMLLLGCPRVFRAMRPLVLSGELIVHRSQLLALLRRDASMRRAHLAAAVLRRRRGATPQLAPPPGHE